MDQEFGGLRYRRDNEGEQAVTLLDKADAPAANAPLRPIRQAVRLNMVVASLVWAVWLVAGQGQAIESIRRYWSITVTMVFGSLVGGGTSEGGGAVAFPILTKVLHIPADEARVFTYLIQSVGMTAASICILYLRVPIERRVLALAAPAGVVGVVFSATVMAPVMKLATIRVYFTVLLTSLALTLLIMHFRRVHDRNGRVPIFGARETTIVLATGLAGGILSGAVGVGENTVAFIVMVMLFRISEKVATPTSVILMTIVSIAASLTHVVALHDVNATVTGYWLAAAPIVVVGAPVGALICSRMSRTAIRLLLVGLIAVEFTSTLVLIPIPAITMLICTGMLVAVTTGCYLMTRVSRYDPAATRDTIGAH